MAELRKEMNELKPCPFCGINLTSDVMMPGSQDVLNHPANACLLSEIIWFRDDEDVVGKWNTRAASTPEAQGEGEKLSGGTVLFLDLAKRLVHRIMDAVPEGEVDVELNLVNIIAERDKLRATPPPSDVVEKEAEVYADSKTHRGNVTWHARFKGYLAGAASSRKVGRVGDEAWKVVMEGDDLLPRMNEDDPMAPAIHDWWQKVRALNAGEGR